MHNTDEYFQGLSALFESSFPKKCSVCGKVYKNSDQFLSETQNMPNGRSSLKEAIEDNGTAIVEVFRNCACGSTLMDEFNSRRDNSSQGQKRRLQFDKLLNILQKQGITTEIGRREIINFINGQHSDIIDSIRKKEGQ
ncbi:oxidoreductase [Methylomonas lenta]|uniref:Oxidoreductase n=1 Tax=Methylomonas lenta TaxID=980561 RepID=A0A177MWW1_9GAMM|nr:oxidoreductase [Methylomonas lenta]OAI10217.1 oxidoreductase [Methylomonas lenta]